MSVARWFSLAVLILTSAVHAAPVFQNFHELVGGLRLESARSLVRSDRAVKVAIFDNDFTGYESAIGQSLPKQTQLVPGPVARTGTGSRHGLAMAQITYLTMTNEQNLNVPAEFYLYNTDGFSNFKFAIEDSIRRGIDVILYAQVWEFGSNFDGKGFINQTVSQATRAGILWVNAAGNFDTLTFNSSVQDGNDHWLRLPGQNSSVELRCRPHSGSKCPVRIALSWNSFQDDANAGTNKDLDLVLTDDLLNIVETSGLKQVESSTSDAPGITKYAREIIATELKSGLYFIRIKNQSQNFTSSDKLRIAVSGDGVEMAQGQSGESILPPADHPDVLTVGASDAQLSSRSSRLSKPEIVTLSKITTQSGDTFAGSSTAAAVTGGVAALLVNLRDHLSKSELLKIAHYGSASGVDSGELGDLAPTAPAGCYAPVVGSGSVMPPYASVFFSYGAVPVHTRSGVKLLFIQDPWAMYPQLRRQGDDVLFVGPQGVGQVSRAQFLVYGPSYYELFQVPEGRSVCGLDGRPTGGTGRGDSGRGSGPSRGRASGHQLGLPSADILRDWIKH